MKFRPALLVVPAVLALAAGPAAAADSSQTVKLTELNDSGASSTATLKLDGNQLHVKIEGSGLVPNAPHAQHIHGAADGHTNFTCPTQDADKNGDGVVNVAEGLPSYGDITVSLTTKGDTSKKSGLAVDRMPVADEDGNLNYERHITVSDAVAKNLKNLHVVQHGIDLNGNDKYDFDTKQGKSELNPKVPAEATHPATCGMLHGSTVGAKPAGGVETGGTGTQGVESTGVVALGGVALAGAAALTVVARRRRAGEAS